MIRRQASKPAMRRAMFHISSDSARFDNIAVLSGSGSPDRLVATCSIAFPSHTCLGKVLPKINSKPRAIALTD